MQGLYLVRFGWQGEISRAAFDSQASPTTSPLRGQKVVVDCGRGLEVGECLGMCESETTDYSGQILRVMTPEDQIVIGQLRSLAQLAYERCVSWLEQIGSDNLLLEVEPSLDGRSLFFYFLSEPDETIDNQLNELVNLYENEVTKSEFVKLVERGCGPGCGTAMATSHCSSSGCSNCKTGCAVRKRPQ